MKEIAVVGVDGGAGKTSLVASFAALSGNVVLAECDVNGTALGGLLKASPCRRENFLCRHEAVIRQKDCVRCGACLAVCRSGAVMRMAADDTFMGVKTWCENCSDGCKRSCPVKFAEMIESMRAAGAPQEYAFVIDPTICEGCGMCAASCPVKAIDAPERLGGEWQLFDTCYGPMIQARLRSGGMVSGRLVSMLRENARRIAEEWKTDLVLLNGPPAAGSAVVASLRGVSLILIVTEPAMQGGRAVEGILRLARHFGIHCAVCVRNWDLNPEMTGQIERKTRQEGAAIAGRVRCGAAFAGALAHAKTVMERDEGSPADDMRAVWEKIHA